VIRWPTTPAPHAVFHAKAEKIIDARVPDRYFGGSISLQDRRCVRKKRFSTYKKVRTTMPAPFSTYLGHFNASVQRTLSAVGVASAALLAFSTQNALAECYVSKQQYGEIQTHMSYVEATKILGCEGDEMSRTEVAGYTTVMYMWKGSSAGANMNVMFQNGQMITKAQFGLK
jgi:hypothetical protein